MQSRRKEKIDYTSAVESIGADIIRSDRFRSAEKIPHHRYENVAEHSLRVAKQSYRMAVWLRKHGFRVDYGDVVRGSLLHDIGMTESDIHKSPGWRKAYRHPKEGAEIAEREFHANAVQKNAVRRHMWPISVIPPVHTAGWIIGSSDKYCSVKERASRLFQSLHKEG